MSHAHETHETHAQDCEFDPTAFDVTRDDERCWDAARMRIATSDGGSWAVCVAHAQELLDTVDAEFVETKFLDVDDEGLS